MRARRASLGRTGIAVIIAIGAAAPAAAQAQASGGDIGGAVTLCALIGLLAAIPGFALLAAARTTGDATGPVVARAIVAAAAIAILWAVIGFSLANATGSAIIGGLGNALLGGEPDMGVVLIELALALAAGGIVAQAGGARAGTGWSIVVALLWVLLVYVPISWWLRGGGWLIGLGALDEGGGLTLHLAAGVSALMLGRVARGKGPAQADIVGTVAIGGALVWIGLLALVAGTAAVSASDPAAAAISGLVAAASGALAWFGIDRARSGLANPAAALFGGIAGIAAVSAGAAYIGVAGAIVAGALAGGVGAFIAGVSDRQGLFAMHGVGGAIGGLLLAFLFLPAFGGAGYPEGTRAFTAFTAEAVAMVVVGLWAASISLVIGLAVSLVLPARPDEA